MNLWRAFFAISALFNLAVGGAMLFGAAPMGAQLGVSGPAATYVVGLSGLLIAMFGVAYAVVAWNPGPNRNLVVIGALGKASAAGLASYHVLLDHIPHSVFVLGAGDLVFALLFALYLRQTRVDARAPAKP